MPDRSNRRRYFFIGLTAISVVYIIYNIYFADNGAYYQSVSRNVRHINSFASVLLVYWIGLLALKKYSVRWIILIWHLLYGSCVLILLGIGGYDWYSGQAAFQFINVARTLHEFLISPVPYVGIAIIRKTLSS